MSERSLVGHALRTVTAKCSKLHFIPHWQTKLNLPVILKETGNSVANTVHMLRRF